MARTPEIGSGFGTRILSKAIDIRTRLKNPEKSIWDRFPELKQIPEDRWPHNIFIIPDGNGRWASFHRKAIQMGHEKGAGVIIRAFKDLNELSDHIPFVGAWGFSMDNLKRPKEEVDFLMNLFDNTVRRIHPDLIERNSKFIHIGRKEILDQHPTLRQTIEMAEDDTRHNTGQTIYIAIGFSGEDQEIRIAQKLAGEVRINPNIEVNKNLIDSLKDGDGLIPSADLIVRTSGEQRLSDIGWLSGRNTELEFLKKFFPDIDTKDFVKALINFSKRDRRFGSRHSTNGVR